MFAYKSIHKLFKPVIAAIVLLLTTSAVRAGEDEKEKEKNQPNIAAIQEIFGGSLAKATGGGAGGKGKADIKTVKSLLAKERNVKIHEMNNKIFLDGRITSEAMRKRVDTLLGTFNNIVDLTEYQPDEDTMLADTETIKQRIEETLNKNFNQVDSFTPRQEVNVQLVNDKIVVSGEVNNNENQKQALQIARIYNNSVVGDLSVKRQMIEVAAIFAKVIKKDSDKVGTTGLQSAIFTLPSLVMAIPEGTAKPTRYPFDIFKQYKTTGTGAAAGFNLQGTTEADNVLSMDFLARDEKSAILARPHLATINGESANFLAGGEKAIKTQTANTSDVEYKKYGVILDIKPQLTTDGKIELKIELEFSVPAANGDDFISFVHKGKAVLAKNQGIALSGLINEARSRSVDRTPYVSQVPILNYFFGKKTQNKDGEELVLIVIPRIPSNIKQAPYATSDRTAKIAEDAMWIEKPSVPRRIFTRNKDKEEDKKAEKKWWIEKEVIIEKPAENNTPADKKSSPVAPENETSAKETAPEANKTETSLDSQPVADEQELPPPPLGIEEGDTASSSHVDNKLFAIAEQTKQATISDVPKLSPVQVEKKIEQKEEKTVVVPGMLPEELD